VRILDVVEAALPVASSMRNAVFSFADMTTSIVAVVTDVVRDGRRVVGHAFNSTGRYACGATMRQRFIPRLLAAAPESIADPATGLVDPARALACMLAGEKPGGHAERSIAVGTIETAIWDAVAKALDRPLWHVLAERFNGGRAADRVFCYVGGGWYRPGGTLADLEDEIRRHLDAGYTLVKIKVGGAPLDEDRARIEAALGILGSSQRLAVDANAKFDRDEAHRYARALAPYRLRWFEEPCDPHDYALFAELTEAYAPPLATGENLFSTQDVLNLVRFGGWRADRDLVQVDPPQAYGLTQYARTLAALGTHGFSPASVFPHGGNQMSLAVAAGLRLGGCEAYPGVFGVFGGYADDARVVDGYLPLPERPGIGFEGQNALYAEMRKLAETRP
jgi:L-alanine-DL-glutamate epimerase-like enolase superfamily enzyme